MAALPSDRQGESVSPLLWLRPSILDPAADEACRSLDLQGETMLLQLQDLRPLVSSVALRVKASLPFFHMWKVQMGKIDFQVEENSCGALKKKENQSHDL